MAIAPQRAEIGIRRHFTTEGVHPYDQVRWERRDARITNFRDGTVAFEQLGVEVPEFWSLNATNILAQKYFRGTLGTPEREWSLKQVADRVVDTITAWGIKDGYFVDRAEAETFRDELKHLVIHQKAAFNSPVWFNIGVHGVPQQGSACFILSVEDSMDSILNWYVEEGIIFKGGSGSGVNLSRIRSSHELLKGGGTASGPVSFMRGADASAGTIKSGGKCFREGTLVSTPGGWRPIEQLRIGDLVSTHEGPRAVADFMPNGEKQCYRVVTREGYEVEVTAGHKFAYWDETEGGFETKPIEEFSTGDSLYVLLQASEGGVPIPLLPPEIADPPNATTTVEMQLPNVLDDRLAYVLGLAYGDGELRTEYPYRLRIAFCKDEAGRVSVERFSSYCEELFGERPIVLSDESGHQEVGFTRKRLIEFLRINGIAKGKAGALGFPSLLLQATPDVRAAFLAGVIDADGTYQPRGGWSISSIDRTFLQNLQLLALSLGVPSKLKVSRPARGTWKTLYRLGVVGATFVERLVARLRPYSAKVQVNFVPSFGADKGWGYRPSLLKPLASRVQRRGGYQIVERSVGKNETSGYGAVAVLARHPDAPVADYARELTTTVQVTLEVVVATEIAKTYDIEVEGTHLLSANGLYASNTRRAAKMLILDADHPDIENFIWCKALEERKARVLRDAGFDMDLDGIDSYSIQYQNGNNSVRVTDEFMQAVVDDADWELTARTDGSVIRRVKARDLFRQIAHAAWECADPGMQFDTTINRWHTAPNTGRINGSNPCSEYMHLDNSACNLASLNLLQFLESDGSFDVDGFRAAVEVVFTGQEIIVGNADYPTEKIAENSRKFRELGIGYANLGALLMANGLPYDSDAGRAWAGAITSLMTGHAYATSARTASRMGPFAGFHDNAEPMVNVLRMHQSEAAKIDEELVPPELLSAAQEAWDEAVELAEQYGVRNSQASVLAPTGTIGLLMDCDTTGVEPDLGLVKTKKLVGGGTMSIVNQTVPRALRQLGYAQDQVDQILAYIDEHKSIVGAPYLGADHLPVFACSMGDNTIHYSGHVRMMGAVQPFISGAISKCVTGDTLVPTEDGLVRIGSFYEAEEPDSFRSERVLLASLGGTQKTDAFYYGGQRPVRRVRLRSGHNVTGTPNHRLLVADGGGLTWKALGEIEVGDEVAVRYGADLWATVAPLIPFPHPNLHGSQQHVRVPREMTEDLAFLLGAYASQGSTTTSTWSIRITNSVPAVLSRIAQAANRAFDGSVTVRIRHPKNCCPFVEMNSKTLVRLFELLGCGNRASEKRIPDIVLRAPKAHVLAFLQGLAIDAYTTSSGMAKWAICLDSPALLDDLQSVLTNLGILHGRIAKLNRTNGNSCDEVYASGPYAQEMVRLVPFLEPEKADAAEKLMGQSFAQSTWDVVPGISGRDLYRLVPRDRRPRFSFLLDSRTSQTSRRTLERVASIDGVSLPTWLRSILADGLHFSPVVEADDAGSRIVYDLSVPDTHAFVGNGIVNHNTVNMPEDVTVEDVEQLHVDAWKLGIKAVAIYRDNCKVAQPLSTTKKEGTVVEGGDTAPPGSEAEAKDREVAARIAELEEALQLERARTAEPVVVGAVRERLPRRRRSNTFAFRVADCEGYVTVGEYEDGRPGEVFVKVSKQGSTLAGIMDAFSISISLGLQHGVPLATYVRKYSNMKFEPAGITDDPELRIASSLVDYIFRRLALDYLSYEERLDLGVLSTSERIQPTLPGVEESATPSVGLVDENPVAPESETTTLSADAPSAPPASRASASAASALARAEQRDAPFCYNCGDVMQRAGSCYVCTSCGSTSGCS